ncbi:MAG: threonine/serine exporter family protein [Emergencia timonensis]|uniref:threonine/serine exporter family protein n=1 Tax=Emergencia timonensis TaxID=1776384 RepID=UPI00082CC4FC|nr:threonine/serine exporter family protein [Emergencia timonensis]WNX86923.1 threonine/serine exporter family protein [Emergencia timonensis]
MDFDRVLQGILDIGEEMVVCGAEVNRVEDSIYRMCESYGADRINVFIITSNIQVTMEAPDGRILTHIRRIVRYDANFDRLDYLNDLSRYVCANLPEPDAMRQKFDEVMNRPKQHIALKFIGAILVSGGFTVFFGGSWLDCIAASIDGVVIVLMELFLASREKNQIVYNFVVSVVAGITALLLVQIGLGDHSDKIMIGGIMLLIPGIAMTNAIRDMLIGDIASGLLRLVNSILVAAAIACGFAFTIIVLGGVL